MLNQIYYKKPLGIPYIMIMLILTCTIVSIPTFFDNDLYEVFASHGIPIYWWQYFTGNFEHSIEPKYFFWAHYLGNIFIIGLNGILIERLLGTRKIFMLTLMALLVACIQTRIFFAQPGDTGAGISGVAWAYLPVAFYIWIQCIKHDKRKILKDIIFYLITFSFFMGWIFITGVSPWNGTNRTHFIATIVGLLFLIVHKRMIKEQIEKLAIGEVPILINKTKQDKRLIILTSILPVAMLFILGAYELNLIDPFLQCAVVSKYNKDDLLKNNTHVYYQSYEDIKQQQGKIELVFDEPIREICSIGTSIESEEAIQVQVEYSKDRKHVYINILNDEILSGHKASILLDKIYSESGKKGRMIKLVIQ